MLLITLIDMYSLIVLAAVILSWVQLPYDNPIAQFVNKLMEPLLGPIRRALPSMGGLDFSPIVLLVGLQMLRGLLVGAIWPAPVLTRNTPHKQPDSQSQ